MDISQLIKSNEKLNNLPFLVVFCTIKTLREMGMIKGLGDTDVDRVQP